MSERPVVLVCCVNRAVLVPVLEPGLQMYCAKGAILGTEMSGQLETHCVNRAVLVPVLGPGPINNNS